MIASLLAQTGQIPAPNINYRSIPFVVLAVGAMAMLVLRALSNRVPQWVWTAITILSALVTLVWSTFLLNDLVSTGPREIMMDALVVDNLSMIMALAMCTSVVLTALVAHSYLIRERLEGPEFGVLLLLACAGGILMAQALDLLVMFLGLEIMSIPLYVLAGFHRRRSVSAEASMKYFILGAFSSAVFLYGIALTYGGTGSTHVLFIRSYVSRVLREGGHSLAGQGVLMAGMALVLVGLAFKVAAVPFHQWTPDVYQGAPTPVSGFMAALAKVAGFTALLRVLGQAYVAVRESSPDALVSNTVDRLPWPWIIMALAVLTLVVGAVMALVQVDIKRMMAYSSINHAGYVLVGVAAANQESFRSAAYYLLTYTFTIIGTFAIITVVSGPGDRLHRLESWRGLGRRRPALAMLMTLFLGAQAGVPFTTGFLAKFGVILAAARGEYTLWLALVAMLVTAVSVIFYLRVIMLMYAAPKGEAHAETDLEEANAAALAAAEGRRLYVVPTATWVAIAICAAVTLVGGIWAGPLVALVDRISI